MKEFTKENTLQVKGVAIMLMLMYHLFYPEWVLDEMQINYAPLSKEMVLNVASFGNICVAIFVMLTAYGLTKKVLSMEHVEMADLCKGSVKRFGKLMGNCLVVYGTMNLICFPYFQYETLYGKGKQGCLLMLCDALGLSHMLETPMLNETWWYLEIAYILIFLVPFLALLVKKVKNSLLLLGFLAPFVVHLDTDIGRYLFVAVFGVCMAYGGWLEKWINRKVPAIFYWILGILGTPIILFVRQNAVVQDYFMEYVDAIAAFFILVITVTTLGKVPVIRKILAFIGKHSMNIFLMHTFLYLLVFRKYVYYFKPAIASFMILLLSCLIYSVILEWLKANFWKIGKKLRRKINLH